MAYSVWRHKSNFSLRALTTLFVVPLVVFIILQKTIYIQSLLTLISVGVFREWSRLTLSQNNYFFNYVLFSFLLLFFIPSINNFFLPITFFICGLFYLLFKKNIPNPALVASGYCYLASSIGILTHILPNIGGKNFIILILAMIWLVDTGAFIVGKAIGGAKLAPKISPNKTWSGFFGGIFISAICTWVMYKSFYKQTLPLFFLFVLIALPLAQIGDLLESWCKRFFNVKDSGNFFPGHGGLLDRLDSLFSVSFAIAIWWYICK